MTTIGRTPASPQDFARTLDALTAELKAKKGDLEATRADAEKAAGQAPWSPLKAQYRDAKRKKWGAEEALQELLKEVAPVQLSELKLNIAEERRLASVVRSFEALCTDLAALNKSPEKEEIHPAIARLQHEVRSNVLGKIDAVRDALAAAGACEAVGRFPIAQLALIESAAKKDLAAIEQARAEGLRTLNKSSALKLADLPAIGDAAKALARLVGDPRLAASLVAAGDRVPPNAKADFQKNLAALALLVDSSSSAPDYSTTRVGWHYPQSRLEYRERRFDPWDMYAAESRHDMSRGKLLELAQAVATAERPAEVLDRELVKAFLSEIGVDPRVSSEWRATAKGVRDALAQETFLPLRALNETMEDIFARKDAVGLERDIRQVILDVTRHVTEGDYRSWRYSTPASQKQLSVLDPAQKKAWMDDFSVGSPGTGGDTLKTREEDGTGLLWLTKIGGPSHGFDYGPNCLLPLLANGRTKAIVVEDPRWPHNPAARSYLRLFAYEDKKPVLYLEPLQRDFPHKQLFKDKNEDTLFRLAQVKHAIEKASELGIALSLDPFDDRLVEYLGYSFRREKRPLVVEASGGIFEASDTLGLGHDFVQNRRAVTPPLDRLVIAPGQQPKEQR